MLRTYWEHRLWTSIDIIYFQLFKSKLSHGNPFFEKKDDMQDDTHSQWYVSLV